MTVGDVEGVTRDERVESVALRFRKQPPRQAHRAQRARVEGTPGAGEGVLQETMVETGVVRDEHCVGQALGDFLGDRAKGGCTGDHRVGDAGERLDRRRDGYLRIHQRAPLVYSRRTAGGIRVDPHDSDLGDPVLGRPGPGGFQVDETKRRGE